MDQIQQAARLGFDAIEIHTGAYANAPTPLKPEELDKIREGAEAAARLGLRVHAGHGLNYHNTTAILDIRQIEELNIGHAIIARAVFTGMERAVRDMLKIMNRI
jgi:pyridoxine 5-phosphate synthase